VARLKLFGLQTCFYQKYAIKKKIGMGSTASVYQIADKSTGQQYACKMFKKESFQDSTVQVKAIINEVKILRDLKGCPEFVQLFEIHETEKFICLVMELLNGAKVFNCCFEGRKCDIDVLLHQTVKSLALLHTKRIVHRDMKPDNIMLRHPGKSLSENEIVILDFGLSAYESEKSFVLRKCGTRSYAAPELKTSSKSVLVSKQVDVFALGVIVYNSITGKRPLNDAKNQAIPPEIADSIFDFKDPTFKKFNPKGEITSNRLSLGHAQRRPRKAPQRATGSLPRFLPTEQFNQQMHVPATETQQPFNRESQTAFYPDQHLFRTRKYQNEFPSNRKQVQVEFKHLEFPLQHNWQSREELHNHCQ
jgi:calcium/calmodulin-dependent protein kinase I